MSDDPQLPAKEKQPHGGALYRGGVPGNRGGGRPPNAVRAACREDFDKLRPKLAKIARSRKTRDRDVISAIDVLGKYGMGTTVSVDDVKEALLQTTKEIREFLPRDQAEALLAKIQPHWLSL